MSDFLFRLLARLQPRRLCMHVDEAARVDFYTTFIREHPDLIEFLWAIQLVLLADTLLMNTPDTVESRAEVARRIRLRMDEARLVSEAEMVAWQAEWKLQEEADG